MKLTPINIFLSEYPEVIIKFLSGAKIYDSSSSPSARVIYADKDEGYFIKSAAKGELNDENVMTNYFCKKGLSSTVIAYISKDKDYLVTKKIVGEDCISETYLQNPVKLCDILAESLSNLHNIDFYDCPIKNHSEKYIARAIKNYESGNYDKTLFSANSAQSAISFITRYSSALNNEALIHGDYCLPNIILNNWKLSGYIDLGYAGVGDRHIDIYWALWSLRYNLKTDKYSKRFLDAYGREFIDNDKLKLIDAIEKFG